MIGGISFVTGPKIEYIPLPSMETASAAKDFAAPEPTDKNQRVGCGDIEWLSVHLFFGKLDPATAALCTHLTRLLLPAQLFFFIGGVLGSRLLVRKIFLYQAATPLLYNLGIILGGVFLAERLGSFGVEGQNSPAKVSLERGARGRDGAGHVLGARVRGKFQIRYCGGGSLRRCRQLLWDALDAGKRLATAQGPDPARWRESATRERISFVPGLLTEPGDPGLPAGRYTI